MNFETSHLIQALENLESSSFLAYSTCKAKIEKPILFRLAKELEQILKIEDQEDIHVSFEYTYNNFLNSKHRMLGKQKSDLVIADAKSVKYKGKDKERVHVVVEAKLYYTFDYKSENMKKKKIIPDLRRLLEIKYNICGEEIQKYFLLFLVHYSSEKVHDTLFAYGAGHNRQMKNLSSNEELFSLAQKEMKEFFEIDLKNKYKLDYNLNLSKIIETKLGYFRNTEIKLISFLIEVE